MTKVEERKILWIAIRTFLVAGLGVGGILFSATEVIKLGLWPIALPMIFGALQLLWINYNKLMGIVKQLEEA